MSTTKTITLNTIPIGVNSLYSVFRGKKLLTKKGRERKEKMARELKSKWDGVITKEEIPLIEITWFFKDKRRRDVDGPIKFVLDALSGVVYEDDSQIQSICVSKVRRKEGGIIIKIHYDKSNK